jgi:hypothetical protein
MVAVSLLGAVSASDPDRGVLPGMGVTLTY